jgi:predicted metal-dependent hydrolase
MERIPVEKVIRSRRRTTALEVTPAATLVVRAPLRASAAFIDEMIRQKSTWILRKMEEMKKRPASPCHEYVEGELFLFLGRAYTLHFVDDRSITIKRSDRLYVSRMLMPDIRKHLKRWCIEEAGKELHARCTWFSLKTGYVPATVSITNARQRWGSCTHKGGLNFSWRLIQAPPDIIDYVVVHELVHISQPDHSKQFWAKVQKILPDYKQRRKWLRENDQLLKI